MITEPYAQAAFESECNDVARTISGRNGRLSRAAFYLGQLVGAGALDHHVVEYHLLHAAEACGYVAKDGIAAARATIRSGLEGGERRPREMPPGRRQTNQPRSAIAADTTPTARFLWSIRQPLNESYLRGARGLQGPFPATLSYLPARGKHVPAMIAAFGVAAEPNPGVVALDAADVTAVHLTKLTADGTRKIRTLPNKIMLGRPKNAPIVLAPPNDLLGLCITEGIEDGLSAHEATGLGAWAAGSASLMPSLADAVPNYIDCVSILAHRDSDGVKYAKKLAANLQARGIRCAVTFLELERAA